MTFRTGDWLVYLDVEVNRFNMPVESAFLAEDVGSSSLPVC